MRAISCWYTATSLGQRSTNESKACRVRVRVRVRVSYPYP